MSISPSIHQLAPSKWDSFEVENSWRSPREAFSSGSNLLASITNVVSSIFENIAIAAKCVANKFIAIGNKTYELIFSRSKEDTFTASDADDISEPVVLEQEISADALAETNAPVFTDIEEEMATDDLAFGEEELPDVQIQEELTPLEISAGTSWKKTAAIGSVGTVAAAALGYIAYIASQGSSYTGT